MLLDMPLGDELELLSDANRHDIFKFVTCIDVHEKPPAI
jgi:hypothetical protein